MCVCIQVLVIVDAKPKALGLPTDAYYAVEEVHDVRLCAHTCTTCAHTALVVIHKPPYLDVSFFAMIKKYIT